MSVPKNFSECESVRVSLVALIDGELDPARADIVREHFMSCDSCLAAHSEVVALLEMTRDALSIDQLADYTSRDSNIAGPSVEGSQTALLLAELRSLHGEVTTLRAEMSEMRSLLINLRSRIAEMPARPTMRPALPYSPAIDRMRTDR